MLPHWLSPHCLSSSLTRRSSVRSFSKNQSWAGVRYCYVRCVLSRGRDASLPILFCTYCQFILLFCTYCQLMLQTRVARWKGATDLKGVMRAVVPFYASFHCHFMIQGTRRKNLAVSYVEGERPGRRYLINTFKPAKWVCYVNALLVQYKVTAARDAENKAYISKVFEQLREHQPSGLRYASFKLRDGVSFVHIVSGETTDGPNPLTDLPAFKAFYRQRK